MTKHQLKKKKLQNTFVVKLLEMKYKLIIKKNIVTEIIKIYKIAIIKEMG